MATFESSYDLKESFIICESIEEVLEALKAIIGSRLRDVMFERCPHLGDKNKYTFEEALSFSLLGKDSKGNLCYFWVPRSLTNLPFDVGFTHVGQYASWQIMIKRK